MPASVRLEGFGHELPGGGGRQGPGVWITTIPPRMPLEPAVAGLPGQTSPGHASPPEALGIRHTEAKALAPDPFDEEIERLLADPDVLRRLDELEERRQRGELVLHDDAEVRRRLEATGVRLPEPNEGE